VLIYDFRVEALFASDFAVIGSEFRWLCTVFATSTPHVFCLWLFDWVFRFNLPSCRAVFRTRPLSEPEYYSFDFIITDERTQFLFSLCAAATTSTVWQVERSFEHSSNFRSHSSWVCFNWLLNGRFTIGAISVIRLVSSFTETALPLYSHTNSIAISFSTTILLWSPFESSRFELWKFSCFCSPKILSVFLFSFTVRFSRLKIWWPTNGFPDRSCSSVDSKPWALCPKSLYSCSFKAKRIFSSTFPLIGKANRSLPFTVCTSLLRLGRLTNTAFSFTRVNRRVVGRSCSFFRFPSDIPIFIVRSICTFQLTLGFVPSNCWS
jgi:hypothetical protein